MDSKDEESKIVINSNGNLIENKKETPITPFYKHVFLEYSLMSELLLLKQQSLSGIYVVPSSHTSLTWTGVIFIKQGIYQGGQFKFKLLIPCNFPDSGPDALIFTPPVFHPLIHPTTGELDVKRVFHPWKKSIHHLWNLVAYAKTCFSNVDIVEPLNEEATDLFQNDSELFKAKVQESIGRCSGQLVSDSPDDCSLGFSNLDDDSLLSIKKQIMEDYKDSKIVNTPEGRNDIKSLGLSWISTRK